MCNAATQKSYSTKENKTKKQKKQKKNLSHLHNFEIEVIKI